MSRVVRHLLWPDHRDTTAPQRDTVEALAIAAAFAEAACGKQACLGQPGSGSIRLEDMPDAWITCGEARSAAAHVIPSTSIIE